MPSALPPVLRIVAPVLLVLGLVGMHGLVGGPSAQGGHTATSVAAPDLVGEQGVTAAGHDGHGQGGAPDGHSHLLELCLAVLGGLLGAVVLGTATRTVPAASVLSWTARRLRALVPRAPDLLALQVSRT